MIIMIIHMQVYSKPRSDQECEKEYEQFALHVKIRSNDCSLSDKISAMEKKFERYICISYNHTTSRISLLLHDDGGEAEAEC